MIICRDLLSTTLKMDALFCTLVPWFAIRLQYDHKS
jgi:hypothetical protein